jgi:hypothetical protein
MLADFSRRASTTLFRLAVCAVSILVSAGSALAGATAPDKPAFIFLDLPNRAAHGTAEFPVSSFAYDAVAGVPLASSAAVGPDADVRASVQVVEEGARAPLAANRRFERLEIVELDERRGVLRRLTFHAVTIGRVRLAGGDEPSRSVTFTARSVTIR